MINTQYINLNMTPSGVMPMLYCSQYDIGRPLGVVVYNGGEMVDLDDFTVTIEATRTDGTAITAAVTTDDNIGAFVTTATMTNQADKYPAKLVLFDSNSRRVASLAFIMYVTPATMDENAESIEEDASLYQQYTGTVQSLIADIREDIAAVNAYLESMPAKMNGGQIAISRQAILFDFAEDTDYKLIQGVACDGAYFYVFKAATSGSISALIKYDVTTYAVVKSITVNHAHVGDATVYNNRLYYTDNSSVYSMDLSLTGAETTEASVALHTIEYYDGYFYSVNANTLYKYDTSFSLVSTVSLPVPSGGVPGAQQGISIHDGLVFSCRYFPNAVFVYDLNGNPIAYYTLGHINGVYMVGELEDLVWVGDTAIAITSQYTGQNADDRAQQFFALDFKKGVVSRADAVGAGYKRAYVNPTATRFDSDGSSGAPYASASWAVRESCAIFGTANQTLVSVTPGTTLKDGLLSINGVSNVVIQSTGAKVKTHGIAIQGASNVTVSAFSAVYDAAGSYANDAMVSVVYSDAILQDVDIDCKNSTKIPLFVNQSTLNAHGGTTSNAASGITNKFNNSETILSRDGDPEGVVTGKGAGPYISTMTSKFVSAEDRHYIYNRIGQHTGFFAFEIDLAQNPMSEGTFSYNFESLVPHEFKTLVPYWVTVTPYGVPVAAVESLGNPYLTTKYNLAIKTPASANDGVLRVGILYQYDVTA